MYLYKPYRKKFKSLKYAFSIDILSIEIIFFFMEIKISQLQKYIITNKTAMYYVYINLPEFFARQPLHSFQ